MTRYNFNKTFKNYIDEKGGRVGDSEIYITNKYMYVFNVNKMLIRKMLRKSYFYDDNIILLLKHIIKSKDNKKYYRILLNAEMIKNKKIFKREVIINVL